MKKLFTQIFPAIFLLGITEVSQAGNDVKAIVESANTAWNAAFNKKDAQALAALYAENATLSPGNGEVLKGRAQIAGLFQSFFDAGVNQHTLEIVEVGGAGNTIYQVSKWSAKGAAKDGVAPTFGGVTTSVLEKGKDGKWYATNHVWNAKP